MFGLKGRRATGPTGPTGVVELLDARRLRGWVLDGGIAATLRIEVGGTAHQCAVERLERADVTNAYGESARLAGFQCRLPPDLGAALVDSVAAGKSVRFFAGELALTVLESAADRLPVGGNLDRVENFALHGWAISGTAVPGSLALRVDGARVDLRPAWMARRDVSRQLGLDPEQHIGFVADLPGYLWAVRKDRPADDALRLQLEIEGVPVGDVVELPPDVVVSWIEASCAQEDQAQDLMLVVLEHLHYGEWAGRLSATAVSRVEAFASRFGLLDYLGVVGGETGPPVVDWLTNRLWSALRELNTVLGADCSADALWDAFLQVKAGITFSSVSQNFCDSVVPVMCRLGIYDRLVALDDVDAERWRRWESADSTWKLALAIPAWLAANRADKAAEVLWKFPERIGSGWLNTDCLAHAAREAVRGLEEGRIERWQVQKFIYAYVGLLDALRADWHSRLTDEALLSGALALLHALPQYPDFLRKDLVNGMLRNYGLLPEFWRRAETGYHLRQQLAWSDGRRAWGAIQAYFDRDAPADPRTWMELVSSLRRFDRLGNPDARRFSREILGRYLAQVNEDPQHPGHLLLDFLLEEPVESVRYSAHPLAAPSRLGENHVACGGGLSTVLRGLTKRGKDTGYDRHREWGGAVSRIARQSRSGGDGAGEDLQAWLRALKREARQGDLRAVDLVSWLLVHGGLLAGDAAEYKVIADALLEHGGKLPVPAPLHAALNRLLPALPDARAQELRAMAGAMFSDQLELAPVVRDGLAMRASAGSWPGDTLVVIYSCRKFLETRIAAIRATWMKDLQERGIPYLVLVGDGDDCVHGDLLALQVSDEYEALPQKTLKLLDWFRTRTDFQYLYKVDDDNYVDVARMFENLGYRHHHYYGRVIRREAGGMDRLWHQGKSRSEWARRSLDKSPEPSIYADGGAGWVLSRAAVQAALGALDSQGGQKLVVHSLMEDKLLGDLLALAGFEPCDEEYESYQRRRTFSGAVPVGMIENIFFPGRNSPTVMCHLDSEQDQSVAHALKDATDLWPKKAWPTCSGVSIAWDAHGNQLELLSGPERLRATLAAPPHVIAVVRNESTLLPHFLTHYRNLGFCSFLIVDNCSDDGTREYLLQQPDVTVFSADTEYRSSHYGVAWQQALLGNFCLDRWALLADADEFLLYPGCEDRPITEFLADIEAGGADAARVGMIDMYPFGDLADADFDSMSPFEAAPWFDRTPLVPWRLGHGHFGNAVTYLSALRHRLDPMAEPNAFTAAKTALIRYRPWVRFCNGVHDASGVSLSTRWAWFAHFKYHAGFKSKVETEIRRGQHFKDAAEYRRYAGMLSEGQGSFGVDGLSVRYEDSRTLEGLLPPGASTGKE